MNNFKGKEFNGYQEDKILEHKETDPLKQDVTNPNNEKEIAPKRNFCQKCAVVVRSITVEPTIVFFIVACMITVLTTQNLSLEKACRVNLNFTDEICDTLKIQNTTGKSEFEVAAQKLIASAMAWKTYLTATVPTLLSICVGSWSDKTGRRKIFIIITLSGAILACINNILNVFFFRQLSLEFLVFSEGIIEAFYGGWCLILLTVFAYISAITTEEERTFRMGLINFSLTVGYPIGLGLSGVLLKVVGYYGCYGIAITLHICNLLYNLFFIRDPPRSEEQRKHDGRGLLYFFKTFFDLSNMKETVRVVFKKGANNRRLRVIILISVVTFLFGPFYGEISIMYILTRYRFNWDEVNFSLFQSYNFVTHTVGTVFSITVLSKYLQWHDSLLGILSTVSKIAASFIYCFATTSTVFFIAPLVETLGGTGLLAMRSIFSKLVEKDELGRVNSILSMTENLMPLVYVPLYTQVYTATMEVLPGTVFLVGALMTLPAVIAFIWLFYEHRKKQSTNRRIENSEQKL